MITNKQKLLKNKTGDNFIEIEDNVFKSKKADAILVNKNNIAELIKIKCFEEIPYLPNKLLQQFLPDRYKNELYLLDAKALAKYDYTILSNQIKDITFTDSVLNFFDNNMAELICSGSEQIETKNHYIFYLKND